MNGFLGGFARAVTAPLHRLFSASHSDVDASATPADGDVPTYVAATGKWTPQAPGGGGSGGLRRDSRHVCDGIETAIDVDLPVTALHATITVVATIDGADPGVDLHLQDAGLADATDPLLADSSLISNVSWELPFLEGTLVAVLGRIVPGQGGGTPTFKTGALVGPLAGATLTIRTYETATLTPTPLPAGALIEVWAQEV
jgi:hypothetical protein